MKRKQTNENAESTEIFTKREYRIIIQALFDYMMSVDRARLPIYIDPASDRAVKDFYNEINTLYKKVVHLQPEEDE